MRNSLTLLLIAAPFAYQKYSVTLRRINDQVPLLNSQLNQSEFTFNYNPAYVPIYGKDG